MGGAGLGPLPPVRRGSARRSRPADSGVLGDSQTCLGDGGQVDLCSPRGYILPFLPSLSIALLRGIYLLITCSLSCFSASSKETHVEALFSMWKLVRWKSLESSVALCVCAQLFSHVQLFAIPWTVSPPGSSVHFPSKNTESGCHFLLQGIFLTQGGQIRISHIGRWILYH